MSKRRQEEAPQEQKSGIKQRIAFVSGLFQEDLTLRRLLESLAQGVVVVDSSGAILFANTQAETMFGYAKDELTGKPHFLLIPERFRSVHEGHMAHFFKEASARPMGIGLDLSGCRKDGSDFPVEISLSYIETIHGVLVIALISDITIRKQFELRLRESEELFRIQVESVKDYAIFMLDTKGNIMNWNAGAESLKGYRAEEIIGKHFSCFYTEEDRNADTPAHQLEKAAAEGRTEDEGWRVRKNGSRFWADVIITAVRDEKGKLRGFSKVTRDITERKRAEEEIKSLNTILAAHAAELEGVNRELETFSYTVAHDLRKPLTIINGYAQVLSEICGDKLDAECKGYVTETYEGTLRMNRLIDALLNFARVAHTEPKRERVNLCAISQEVASQLKLAEPERHVTFHIPSGIVAEADPDLLRVVLGNLLGNAWKYTSYREEGVIEFGATEIDGKRAYFVRDNGLGFDPAEAEKLFAPFQRLESGKEVGGLGIGLATVDRIITRHGGKVWAEGKPGEGATFYFTVQA